MHVCTEAGLELISPPKNTKLFRSLLMKGAVTINLIGLCRSNMVRTFPHHEEERKWEVFLTCDDLAIESQILYGCRRSCGRSLSLSHLSAFSSFSPLFTIPLLGSFICCSNEKLKFKTLLKLNPL